MTNILHGTARYRPLSGRRYIHPSDTNPPELPWLAPDTDYFVPVGGTLHDVPDSGDNVTNGNNLIAAINAAADGDKIQLHPGVRYHVRQVPLPQRSNWTFIFVASKLSGTFPLASSVYHIGGTQTQGQRVGPQHSWATLGATSPLAQIVLLDDGTHSNADPIFYTNLGGGGFWWFEGIEFMVEETLTTSAPTRGLLQLGTTTASTGWYPTLVKDIPSHFNFGHCLFHGTKLSDGPPATFSNGPRRAIDVNASHVGVRDSSMYYIQVAGTESQAIGGWNTPGVFSSVNNFIAAPSQAILFGGSPPYVPGVVMRNFTTKWTHLWKDTRWFWSTGQTAQFSCKNHYEHKNGTHILVEDVVMEHNTDQGQDGMSILFQNLLDQANSPQTNKITDVTLRNLSVTGGGPLLQVAGGWSPNTPTPLDFSEQPTSRMLMTNVRADSITGALPEANAPGNPASTNGFELQDSLRDLTIEHVSMESRGVGLIFTNINGVWDSDAVSRLTLRNNIIGHGLYGTFFGSDVGTEGTAGLDGPPVQVKGYDVERNVFYTTNASYADPPASNPNSAENAYLADVASVGFDTNYAADKPSALAAASAYKGYGTDGADPGADVATINAMETAVKSTTLPS